MKIIKWVAKEALRPDLPATPVPEKGGPKGKRGATPSKRGANASKAEVSHPPATETEQIRVVEVRQEPTHTVLPGQSKELAMRASVVADVIPFSIDGTEITFAPTMMCQKRIAECKITNECQIRFDYTWRVFKFVNLRTHYAQTRPSAFSVAPVSGFIEAGGSTVFRVIFEPLEVDDFTGQMFCDIPFLSNCEPPALLLSGLSRRPLCHFNVELSDYLTAGRRHPDYTYKLPDDIKIIEFFAKGIGQKISKRFELINPTASAYEITWKYIGEGQTPVMCETPQGLISSGKRSFVMFAYLPVSVKTIESLWEFQIPEQSVRVPFLFVGRIMPQ
jgi:hydrocephalus-inducing protein